LKLFNQIIMKRYTLCLFITGLIFTYSCKKSWLDAKPNENLATPTTLQDCQAMLDDALLMNTHSNVLGEAGSDGHYITNATYNSCYDWEKNAYTWSHSKPYLSTSSVDWFYTYQNILYTNIVIETLNKIKPSTPIDQQTWNAIMADALFKRSSYFYEISQTWAPQYINVSASTDPGIPLRLSSDPNLPTTRSTVKDTYSQIIGDLLTAANLAPTSVAYLTRCSKAAAYGMLARVYLSIGDYTNAGNNADAALKINSTLLDYNTLNPSATSIQKFNSETVYFGQSISGFYPIQKSLIDSALYSSYDLNDLRRSVFFGKNTDGTMYFKGNYTGSSLSAIFTGIAVDELFLIRAECSARAGNTSAAIGDLNTLLKTRWKNTVPFAAHTAANADDALNQILTERKKELLYRTLRWSDLRRLNLDSKFAITISRTTIAGANFTLAPNSYMYTYPIPDDIITISGIKQNAGW
jgi:hypothetical protein